MYRRLAVLVLSGVAAAPLADEPAASATAGEDLSQLSIDEIGRRLDNPLTNLWSLTFQYNGSTLTGDAIDGDRNSHVTFFQPALPVPVGEDYDKIFIARPGVPGGEDPRNRSHPARGYRRL